MYLILKWGQWKWWQGNYWSQEAQRNPYCWAWIIITIGQYCTWTRPIGAGVALLQMTLLLYEVSDLNKSFNNGKFWAGCQKVSNFNTLDTRHQIWSSCVLSSIRLIYSKAFLSSKCVYLMKEQHQNEMYCILGVPISHTFQTSSFRTLARGLPVVGLLSPWYTGHCTEVNYN